MVNVSAKRKSAEDAKERSSARKKAFVLYMKRNWALYLLLVPAIVDVALFCYVPMYGIQIAFRRFKAADGISGSQWVGLKYFEQFVNLPAFWRLMRNTLLISVSSLIFGFPLPIILALLLNEARSGALKKTTQMLTYMPHFISTVAMVGLVSFMVDPSSGLLNIVRGAFGLEKLNYMGMSSAFRPIYVISGIWQGTGWGAIMYLAALSSVDAEIHEAARIDGASRLQGIWYINIPTILPTIVVLLILNCGSLLGVGFEKAYLLQNSLNSDVSEIISTYVYKQGIMGGEFSFTTAIGLFNNIINAIILLVVNATAKKVSGSSLW